MATNKSNPQKEFGVGEHDAGKKFLELNRARVYAKNGSYTIYTLGDGSQWHEFSGEHEDGGDGQIDYWLKPYTP